METRKKKDLDKKIGNVNDKKSSVSKLCEIRKGSYPEGSEEALYRECSRIQTYMDTLETIIVVLDRKGKITTINKSGRRLLSCKKNDLIGQSWFSRCLPQPEGAETAYPLFLKLMEGKIKTAEFLKNPILTRKRELRQIAWHNRLLRDEKGQLIGALISGEDITERYKMEKELRKSEEKFSKIFQTSSYAIIITRSKDGKIIDSNDAFTKITGFSRKEALASSSIGLKLWVNKEDRQRLLADLDTSQSVVNREYLFRKKNGDTLTGLYSAQPIRLDQESCILSSVADITELKKAEREVKESESALKDSQIIASLGSYDLDIDTDSWKSSEVLDKVFGIDSKYERTIKGWIDLLHPDDSNVMASYFKNYVLGKGKYFNKEYRIVRQSDKAVRWVHGLGKLVFNAKKRPIRMFGTIQDITEHKEMEDKILELKDRNEAILNSIGDAVFASNKDGIILLFNKMAEEMTGVSAEEAIGKHYKQTIAFVGESDGKPSDDFIFKTIEKNTITKMANHVMLLRKDGQKIPVADSAAPIKSADGKIIGCVVVFHDVTKERQIDKAKTEFVSLASHQLRTPLSTINWYSEMLLSLDVGSLAPKQLQYCQEVYHASQRMAQLVDALLNVSRLEMGTFVVEPKTVNIAKIAEVCLNELRLKILKKKLSIRQKYDDNVSTIKADPNLLKIVFQNLISNSVKYTGIGGKISLKISKGKDGVIISISDTGIGIPEEQQKEIFEKLFRADNAKLIDPDGTGLGLYIVKEIVEHTGGKIWIKSSEGKGSAFYVSIPLSGMLKKTGSKYLIGKNEK